MGTESGTASSGRRASAVSTALAAAAIGILQIGVAVSLAALIFSGPLSAGAGRASAGFILATTIMLVAVALRSRVTPVIAGVQDTAAIVSAAVAASIAADTTAPQQVPTVLVMLACAGLGTAVAMWLIGRFGLGAIVRFLPYPVISGFVAGTGWLLFRGGIEVMIGRPLHFSELAEVFPWSTSKYLVIGLALGLFMVVCVARGITSVAISAAILLTTILFHVVAQSVTDLGTLESQGWLIGPFPEGGAWKPIGPSDFSAAEWGVLAQNWVGIVAIIAVSIVGVMLNLTGLEEIVDGEIDVDHELRLVGAANVPIAVGGGLISYHLIGDTTLYTKLKVRTSSTPLAIAALGLALFLFGYDLIALMPRAVAGGVLVGIGLTVLVEWARGTLSRMTRADAGVSSLILLIIAAAGILTGVGVGLVVATLFFVVRYSRIDPVRHVVAAAGRSNVDRPPSQRRMLRQARSEIAAVELQGYLFFGSISGVRARIDAHAEQVADAGGDLRFLIIDFGRVTGVDLTAATGIRSLIASLQGHGTTVILSGVDDATHAELDALDLSSSIAQPDYDRAVAWAEEALLAHLAGSEPSEVVGDEATVLPLFGELPVRHVRAGETVIDASESNRDLYVLESGVLTAWASLDGGRKARFRQISAGAIIGEMAFCTGAARTADVIADTDASIRVLTRAHFETLREHDAEQAMEIQGFLLRRLSYRLSDTSSLVRDLMR